MRINRHLAIAGSGQFGISSAYDCHVYAVRAPDGVVLIDSGSGLAEVEIVSTLAMEFPGIDVAAILLTHAHMDHSGGARDLGRRFQCPIIASDISKPIIEAADEERSGLRRARETGGYPADLQMAPCHVDMTYRDGERITVAGLTFEAIHVRGHSQDSFCLLTSVNGSRTCFSGDTIFYGGILGVINAEDSGMQGYSADLRKMQNADVEILLPGHGLFTLKNGQRHIDAGMEKLRSGFLPPQVGQGVSLF